jgi:hypothetical protein
VHQFGVHFTSLDLHLTFNRPTDDLAWALCKNAAASRCALHLIIAPPSASSSKRTVGKGTNRSAQSAVAQTAMSRYRRLKIEGGAFIYALALADRGGRCD